MKSDNSYILPASIIIAAVLIAGSVLFLVGTLKSNNGGNDEEMGPSAESLQVNERDHVLGDPNAPVTLVEYGDYQCPYCGRLFQGAEAQIRNSYVQEGKVKFVFRNVFVVGPESVVAAEAAECAADQGKFWEYHDALYNAEIADGVENNGNLNRSLFLSIANDIGLDREQFESCVVNRDHKALIEADHEAAVAIGVLSTPTSFVNGEEVFVLSQGKKYGGAQPFGVFQEFIERALAAATQ